MLFKSLAGSGTGGSRTGTLGGRTLTTGNANNGENNATCQVQRVVNARGEVIAGKCQEATSSSRSKRQAPVGFRYINNNSCKERQSQ